VLTDRCPSSSVLLGDKKRESQEAVSKSQMSHRPLIDNLVPFVGVSAANVTLYVDPKTLRIRNSDDAVTGSLIQKKTCKRYI